MKLISEFATRWKKEKSPELVEEAKKVRKLYASSSPSDYYKVQQLKPELTAKNKDIKKTMQMWVDASEKAKPGFNKKMSSETDLYNQSKRQKRIEEIKQNPKKKQKSNKLSKSSTKPKKGKSIITPAEDQIKVIQSRVRKSKRELQEKIKEKGRQSFGYQTKMPTSKSADRRQRIKELKQSLENKTKQPKLISTKYPQVSKTIPFSYLDEKFKEGNKNTFSSKYKFPKVAPGTINPPKVISSVMNTSAINNNARQAFNQRLQSVGRNSMKKELLGVAAISGVIGGIALARKVRSDKNKKRGKYRRF